MRFAATAVQRQCVFLLTTIVLVGWAAAQLSSTEVNAAEVNAGQFKSSRVREWTDKSGAHSLEAVLVGYQDGTVRLRKQDGSQISVGLDQLSTADQGFVRRERRRSMASRHRQRSVARPVANPSPVANPNRAASRRMVGIDWCDSSEAAISVAQATNDKPVMWFRVLGDLDGFM